MTSEDIAQDLKFKSSFDQTMITRCLGLAIILFFSDFLGAWVKPSWANLPYMLIPLPVVLPFCFFGGFLALETCDVEIAAGQLRFRRLLKWDSVPLESISRIKLLPAPGVYIRAEHEGRQYRIVFSPHGSQSGPHGRALVKLLQKVCSENAKTQ
jgi:hypothetical protein